MSGRSNASKAGQKLGWKAKYQMEDVVRMIAEAHAGAREESGARRARRMAYSTPRVQKRDIKRKEGRKGGET
jgi:hypothetical protein